MTKMNFSEEDKKKLVEFLNMVAKHATLNLNTSELISYFKLLSHMQQVIIPKIDNNILEIIKVVETKNSGE